MAIPYNLRNRNVKPYADCIDENENFGDDSSESETDEVIEEAHLSDFEGSTSSESETENATQNARVLESRARGRPTTVLKGKNGFKWHTKAETRSSDRSAVSETIIVPAPIHEASNANKIQEFWELLFNNEMVTIIVDCTNLRIEEVCLQMIRDDKELQTYHHHTDVTEIKAFMGLLYYSGRWKSTHVDTEDLWSKKNGITFYRCVMSRSRFIFIAKCLRFDVRACRDPDDRLAPIRKLWEIFIRNCSHYYKPSKYCTVDEQLLSFRGKCRFRMFIKSKPDRYGLKIITLNDARTSYLIHGIPYLGKVGNGPSKTAEDFFREVTKPIHGTKRSVTCDNWFTSIPLLMNMMKPPYNIEITGTIRKNKKEIPVEFLVADKHPPATKFAFAPKLTLISHCPKKNKVVLLATSHLRSTEIVNGKPDIVAHYNMTKGGTDSFDQLCHSYTVARGTRRWPMRFFFGIMDQAIVNARILHNCAVRNRGKDNEILPAKKCLDEMTQYLVQPYLQERFQTPSLRIDLKNGIAGILGTDRDVNPDPSQFVNKIRCRLCPRDRDRKTRRACPSCQRPICDEHRVALCLDCGGVE